mmetsp:Transcript_33997/g.84702  ORF Transcript_33997/g.84702 Transcript_33997/m.84702 type:complete len:194 (-) Transcript_33997:46-627(-)
MGSDAELIGVVDVFWISDEPSMPARAELVAQLPASTFAAEARVEAFARMKRAWVEDMMGAVLFELPAPASSADVRFGQSGVASFLLDLVKKQGLARERVEVAIINGGAVRGNASYPVGPFILKNMYSEFAFPTEFSVLQLPGRTLVQMVTWSHARLKPAPELLHLDGDCTVSEGVLSAINGKPVEPARLYTSL